MLLKKQIKTWLLQLAFALMVASWSTTIAAATNSSSAGSDIRLYALNCGYIDVQDMASFSNTNFYPHKERRLADPCFLIKHPKGWLLWDLGLGDQYVNHPTEDKKHQIVITVPVSLVTQLKQLGLTPNDIQYVAFSHTHFDHTGNVGLFPNATFIMQKTEYEYTQQKPLSSAVTDDLFSILKNKRKTLLTGDYDVFGDGTVQILSTPGHTPGHESLKLQLPKRGVVILSGDLYHTREAYLHKLVPTFNTSEADTLSSMRRIDSILQDTHGQLIVQHDLGDFSSLPKIPNYY
jgi:glyoxylase-like metal-dependent hydrolase (beta-lactamase superfamily II)